MSEAAPSLEERDKEMYGGIGSFSLTMTFDYELAWGTDAYALRCEVLELYQKGYRPQGGIFCRQDGVYIQAMIKEAIE